jgi:hypothetical protein
VQAKSVNARWRGKGGARMAAELSACEKADCEYDLSKQEPKFAT